MKTRELDRGIDIGRGAAFIHTGCRIPYLTNRPTRCSNLPVASQIVLRCQRVPIKIETSDRNKRFLPDAPGKKSRSLKDLDFRPHALLQMRASLNVRIYFGSR